MYFLTQSTLRPNAKAVAHDQHANEQFGIDGRAPDAAVERREMPMQLAQIKKPIDATQLVIGWNVSFKIEAIEQLVVSLAPSSHHLDAPSVVWLMLMTLNASRGSVAFFNDIDPLRSLKINLAESESSHSI